MLDYANAGARAALAGAVAGDEEEKTRAGRRARLPTLLQLVSMRPAACQLLCQIPDTTADTSPGERCRVKRLSKVNLYVNVMAHGA
jgi:hypothetical protein